MTERLSASEFRDDAAEVLNRVAYKGERIVLHRRGKDVAALVSLDDLKLLEDIEDRYDVEEADKAYEAYKASGEEAATLEEVAQELGIPLRRASR